MTRKDIIKRGALEKLEEIVRSCVDSCNGNIDNFQFEMIDVFSTEEHSSYNDQDAQKKRNK